MYLRLYESAVFEAEKKILATAAEKERAKAAKAQERTKAASERAKRIQRKNNPVSKTINDIGRTVKRQMTNQIGRSITRVILGTFFGNRKW